MCGGGAISLCFDDNNVYFCFADVVQLLSQSGFDYVKKNNIGQHCRIVAKNEQVFITDSVDIDIKVALYDEPYIALQAIFDIMDHSMNLLGNKRFVESVLVNCALRVVKIDNHAWYVRYLALILKRIDAAFNAYFVVLRHYMLNNQPHVNTIGEQLNELRNAAEQKKCIKNNHTCLLEAHSAYEKATSLMLHSLL
ncbi:hypothetical protein [Epinotia aporema granulovirus]|uniref:Uncharacterized protein n=1 Tax=Epinotia aporema granulovirus TaxID=166056 RepID=K4EQD4_9BBAC|nr:hypothetical protein [Epinotia aporema granulovirus]AER41433.1 hypothetical protein [Epinotia aporema granulovirus]